VPTRQRVRAVQLAYAAGELARGASVWASPDVLTPAGWLRRECERLAAAAPQEWPRLLSAAEEWVLWRQAAHEASGEYVFFDEGSLARSLQASSALAAEYGIPLGAPARAGEATLLAQAQRLFASRCRELHAASVDQLAARLQGAVEPAAPPVTLRGFDAMPPRLGALTAGRSPATQKTPVASDLVTPRVLRTPESLSEQDAIAAWCATRLAAQPEARLLIMLPGGSGARERLAALIRAALDAPLALRLEGATRTLVGIEGGEPLGELPLPSQALRSLEFLAGAELDCGTLCDWLTAAQWERPQPAQRARLAGLLREQRSTNFTLRELLGALQLAPAPLKPAAHALDSQLRRAAGLLGEGSASPRRWSERFEAALAALTWPGAAAAESAAGQTRLKWRELLEEFGELAASVGAVNRDAAVALLRSLSLRTAYRPADEDAPVTISPMLADPIVHYDGIWVGSLSADVLPQPLAPDPFLPVPAQIAAGVPQASSTARRAQAETLLRAWRSCSADLVLSVPAREQDLELLPSPLLGAWPVQETTAAPAWLPARLHRAGLTETLEDPSGTRWNPLSPLPGGTRALTLQNSCPFRAYAELRLGATAPESAEPGVPMDQRGRLLHAALQSLWERLHDSAALGALDEAALRELIRSCVAQAAQGLLTEPRARGRRKRRTSEAQFDLFSDMPAALVRECARAERLILSLCELERSRPPFTVLATEASAELALAGGRLRMRLDRIDSTAQGKVILDYKSGRAGNPDWYGERPTHPQLLAYLAALGTEVIALATVNVTAREVRFSGIAGVPQLLPKVNVPEPSAGADPWGEQTRAWQALIGRLIGAFLAGEARVDPAPGACDYCHISDICRIGAHRAAESLLSASEEADE
jgi:ATP-dependent helicase/nuclease subunit B